MQTDRTTHRCRATRGFTLLEVILALAILAGAVAVVGEAVRLGRRNAEAARLLTTAQLLAASTMAEVSTGVVAAESVQDEPFESAPDWQYSIDVQALADLEGLVEVTVTVTPTHGGSQSIEFSLTRWMVDPAIEADGLDAADVEAADGSSTNSDGGTGG